MARIRFNGRYYEPGGNEAGVPEQREDGSRELLIVADMTLSEKEASSDTIVHLPVLLEKYVREGKNFFTLKLYTGCVLIWFDGKSYLAAFEDAGKTAASLRQFHGDPVSISRAMLDTAPAAASKKAATLKVRISKTRKKNPKKAQIVQAIAGAALILASLIVATSLYFKHSRLATEGRQMAEDEQALAQLTASLNAKGASVLEELQGRDPLSQIEQVSRLTVGTEMLRYELKDGKLSFVLAGRAAAIEGLEELRKIGAVSDNGEQTTVTIAQ